MRTLLTMGCVIGWTLLCGGCPATTSQGGSAPTYESEEEPATEPALTGDQLEEIKRTVRVGEDSMIGCYEKEMIRQRKKISCKVMIKLVISPEGLAQQVEVDQSGLRSPQFESCLVKTVRSWEFPRLPKATPYSFPYSFSPAY